MWKRECCFLLKEYRKYLKDKNVILVAPAAYLIGRNMGEEIDNYDVVVRINNSLPIPKTLEKDLGSRTDILYHGLFSSGFPKENEKKHWQDIGLKWIVSKLSKDSKRSKKFKEFLGDMDISWLTSYGTMKKISKNVKKSPGQGTITIVHLLEQPIESLVVIGMDFYQTGYYLGYKNLNNEEQIEKIRKRNQKGKFHDMGSQIKYLAKIWKEDDRLKVDDVLEKILKQ